MTISTFKEVSFPTYWFGYNNYVKLSILITEFCNDSNIAIDAEHLLFTCSTTQTFLLKHVALNPIVLH